MAKNFILCGLVMILLTGAAFACSDVQIMAKDGTVIVGRTMEWGAVLKTAPDGKNSIQSLVDYRVRAFPAREKVVSTRPDGHPGLSWTSRYAIFAFAGPESGCLVDGQNEAGLALEALYLPGFTKFPDVTEKDSKVICFNDFNRWVLGNFASIKELKEELASVTVWGAPNRDMQNTIPELHLAAHDRTGASIIIEFTGKSMKVYDNAAGVLTNSPTYDWMITNLRNYVELSRKNVSANYSGRGELTGFGQGTGMLGIPGDYTPPSRFVKLAFLLHNVQQPDGSQDGINVVLHVLNNVDIPFGAIQAKGADGNIVSDYTVFTVIKDLRNNIWHFATYQSKGDFVKFDLNAVFRNPGKYGKAKSIFTITYPDAPDALEQLTR
jgi:penicillin V acylase-like amidase (Ntn superfamily)